MILIVFFILSVLTNEYIGGIDGLDDKVQASAAQHQVVGSYAGTLLTFISKSAIIFGLAFKCGNLAFVTMVCLRLYIAHVTAHDCSGYCILAETFRVRGPIDDSRL